METRRKKRGTRVKESKTKRERVRRKLVEEGRSYPRVEKDWTKMRERGRERERARVAWSRWYTSVLHVVVSRERDNGREEVKETVGGRKRE